jgi:thioredoxin 1
MPVKHVKNLSDLAQIISSEKRAIIIKFSAKWCGPCKTITPIFVGHSDNPQVSKSIVFVEVDVDEAPDIAEKFGVASMPTFKAIKQSMVIGNFSGASREKLSQMIAKCM